MLFRKIKERFLSNKYKNYFIKYCNKNLKTIDSKIKKNIILVEFSPMQPYILPTAFSANVLAKKYSASIISLQVRKINIFKKIEWKLSSFLNLREFKTYRSFNTKKFIYFKFSFEIFFRSLATYLKLRKKTNTKKRIENLKIYNILFGDLIYDTYLKRYSKYTIEPHSLRFSYLLFIFICQVNYVLKIFNTANIKAVLTSHPVYDLAIPLRIALKRNIPAYQSDIHDIRRYDNKRFFFNNFLEFKKIIKKIPHSLINKGKYEAKKCIYKRLYKGISDLGYAKYGSIHKYSKKLILEKNRVNVLVASHCFSDSPHSYGNNLFTDFHEWFEFLKKVSNETDYNWYIKVHKDYQSTTMNYISKFIESNSNFKLLPPDISHVELIKAGIDYCLTVYGTIAHEYPFLNKKVINASVNNPHIKYNFNIHPKSISEYKNILLNLKKYKYFKVNKDEIFEYYFLNYIFFKNYLFIKNHLTFFYKLGSYENLMKDIIYFKILNKKFDSEHVKDKLNKFFDRGHRQFSILDIR
jgi:hypothetical protein